MTSNAKVLGIGVFGLLLGIVGALGGAKLFGPKVTTGPNPPVIIHGGSMHLDLKSSDKLSGDSLPIHADDLTTITLNNYVDPNNNNKSVDTVDIASNYEVDVCEEWDSETKACKPQGLKLCSTASCDTTGKLSPGAGTITITALAKGDLEPNKIPKQYDTQYRFRVRRKKVGSQPAIDFHPGYVQIIQNKVRGPYYTCNSGFDGSQPPPIDWAQCWIAMGSPHE